MDTKNVVAIRRARLQKAINEKFGGVQARCVEEIGINGGELSGLLRDRPFGEKKARSLEGKMGLPVGYLDGADGDETNEVVNEFARVYSLANPKGREILRNAINIAAELYIERRQTSIKVLHERRGSK